MKLPAIVLYTVAGLQRYALVFGSNLAAVDHLGENDEPTLNLAFFAPEREPGSASMRIGYEPTIYKAYDVVHASHEFSEEFKLKNGLQTAAQIASIRGAGEWEEVPVPAPSPSLESLVATVDAKEALQLIFLLRARVTKLDQPIPEFTEAPSDPKLMSIDQARSLMEKVTKQPSADDLDAVEEEQKAKEATSGEPPATQETGDAFHQDAAADSSYPQIL